MNRYDELPPEIELPVPQPHEHQFAIQTEKWDYAQRTVTLRLCSTCGLTHALIYVAGAHFVWEEVKERIAP